jgi:RNA polymerase sigma factor (sigma-70 family)
MQDNELDPRFLEYLRQYRGQLRRLIKKWARPWDDIEEIEQEVFLQLWKTREQIPQRPQPYWLMKVVRNISLKWIGRENRQRGGKWLEPGDQRLTAVPLDDPSAETLRDERLDPESVLISSEGEMTLMQKRQQLYAALAELSPELRDTWVAANLNGDDKAKIASSAGCSRTTVYKRLRDADEFILTKLRVCAVEGAVYDAVAKKRLAAMTTLTPVGKGQARSMNTDLRSPFRFSGLSVGKYNLAGQAPRYQESDEEIEIRLGLNLKDILLMPVAVRPEC